VLSDRLNHPAFALALRIVAAGLSFVFGIVAARLLGIETFGVVSVLLGFINVGIVFALLGHETLATREIAALRRNADQQAARAYSRSASRQVWLAGVVVLCVLLAAVAMLPIGEKAGPEFLALLALVPLVARTRLSQGFIRGVHLASLSLVPDGILRPGLAVLLLGALILAGQEAERGFVVIMLGCALLALLCGRIWERNALAMPSASEGRSAHESAPVRHFSMSIFVSSMLAVLVSQIALISTGLLAEPADAGLYAAAERFSLAAALVGQAVYLAVASRFAALYASGDIAGLRALVRKVTRSVSAATLLLCVVLGIAAAPLLRLYGDAFVSAAPVLQVLLLSVLCNAGAGPTGQVLLMTRNERDHLVAMVASLVLQSVLIALLVPAHGVIGVACAVLASTLVWNGLMMFFIRRRLAINPVLAFA
jgi:O-antigen/teichoic acid export membrane protein